MFSGCLDVLDTCVSRLFEDRTQKEKLRFVDSRNSQLRTSSQDQLTPGTDYRISCYLRKIIASTNSVNILIKFAYSPRMRTRFLQRKSLVTRPVPNRTHPFILPTMQGFGDIALEVVKSGDIFRGSRRQPGSFVKTLYRNQDHQPTQHAPIHCGCAVALQLLKNAKAGQSPSLSYIGVSKLSCFACWKFLESLRECNFINIQVLLPMEISW